MSGDTVTGKALQFTNDNKHAYAYSGDVSVSASNTTMLEFETNSEYLISKFEYHGTIAQLGNNQIAIEVTFNGISILHTFFDATVDHTLYDSPPTLIIPPFTNVKMTLAQASGVDRTMQMTLTAKVGMAPRVGNLNE